MEHIKLINMRVQLWPYTSASSAPLGGPDTPWLTRWLNVSEGPGNVEICACRSGVYGWLTLVTSKTVQLKSKLQHIGIWLAAAYPAVYPCSFFRHLLIVLSLPTGKIRQAFHKCCDRYFRFVTW